MKTKKKVTINALAPFNEKLMDSYGLKIAKLIESEWFPNGPREDGCRFENRLSWIRNKRLLVRGEQSMEDIKKVIDPTIDDAEGSLMNLDWRAINVVEKFCSVVANGIGEQHYRLQVNAVDPLTAKLKKEKEVGFKKSMVVRELNEILKKELGIDLQESGFVPEDEEEMDIYMQMYERPKIEISEEIIIDYIKRVNNWSFIEKEKNRDLTNLGIASARVFTDKKKGVCLEYVDPQFLVHSYQQNNDFTKAHYFGHLDTVTLGEIARTGNFEEQDLRKIVMNASLSEGVGRDYLKTTPIDELYEERVDVMFFCYKTLKTMVYKKTVKGKNRIKVTLRDGSYNPPVRSDYKRLDSSSDTWMEGVYVIGTNFVYDYKECEHIIRDTEKSAICPFIVKTTDLYENRLHSFLNNIEGLSNEIQRINVKIQHLITEMKPDYVNINIDALAELGSGDDKDKEVDWKEALKIFRVKGVIFSKDSDDPSSKGESAARPIPIQQGAALTPLLNSWAHYYNQMREVTGINPFRDGTQPHDSLVGVNRMALLASNTATKHIVDAAIDFHETVCSHISDRVTGVFKHYPVKKLYEDAVGAQNVEGVSLLKGRSLHRFGFFHEMKPTENEVQAFREDLSLAVKEGVLDVEDKIEAEAIAEENPKLARRFLIYRRNKKIKQKREEHIQNQQLQAQTNIQTVQGTEEAKLKAYEQKVQIDLQKELAVSKIRVMEEQAKSAINSAEEGQKFKYETFKKNLEVAANFNLNKFKEDQKTSRQDRNNSQQSKMILQRQQQGSPIDFENNVL